MYMYVRGEGSCICMLGVRGSCICMLGVRSHVYIC